MTPTITHQISETVIEDLRRLRGSNGQRCFPRPRIWDGKDHSRVYTGHGSEFLRVDKDGKVTRSKTNMTWGHLLDSIESGENACETL